MQRALRVPVEAQPSPPTPEPPAPAPEPQPEPESAPPPQPLAQERVPVPDDIDQAKVDRDALAAETAAREQEAKRRQEQIDLTERQRQADAEQKQREAKLADIRRQMAKAAKEASLHAQRLQQLADAKAGSAAEQAALADAQASASPPPGNNGVDTSLQAKYIAAIQAAIRAQWVKPDNVPEGALCRMTIRQLPGGDVMPNSVTFGSPCQFDDAAKDSIERAVMKAEPLPYAGFEKVFNRTLDIKFQAQSR
jgi:colicin import membrane protein